MEVWNECRDMCTYCKVAIEIHLGLGIEEERQLFHDLNQLGKKIDVSLANKYDSSNPINNYVSDVLIGDIFSEIDFEVLDSSTEADWTEEKPSLTRKSLAAINAILFLNKGNINGRHTGRRNRV
ncbi:MAG: DNA sulfur modification protein DndB [Bacteroidota bacterium]